MIYTINVTISLLKIFVIELSTQNNTLLQSKTALIVFPGTFYRSIRLLFSRPFYIPSSAIYPNLTEHMQLIADNANQKTILYFYYIAQGLPYPTFSKFYHRIVHSEQ